MTGAYGERPAPGPKIKTAAPGEGPAVEGEARRQPPQQQPPEHGSTPYTATVIEIRRWCASCGGPTHPRYRFCGTCWHWGKIRAKSAELAALVRAP